MSTSQKRLPGRLISMLVMVSLEQAKHIVNWPECRIALSAEPRRGTLKTEINFHSTESGRHCELVQN